LDPADEWNHRTADACAVRQRRHGHGFGFHCVSFADALNGITVARGTTNNLLRTTNGGSSWISQNIPLEVGAFPDVVFLDPLRAYVVPGSSGSVLRTTDGGSTWVTQQAPYTTVKRAVSFIDANRGIAVGDNGTIITTTTGEILSVPEPLLGDIPSAFHLCQNYPNPFNPSTTIEFDLPRAAQVTVRIFNILGQEIASFLSEPLTAGTHRIVWNAGNLASGVYFYRITTRQTDGGQAKDFTETKKMILLR
jgi:hypothetical protein